MDYPQKLTASDRRWYNIVQQCRTSGKSDYQWLQEHNIKSSTFYYHVKRLRKKACEIPETAREVSKLEIQEVVPVFFEKEEVGVCQLFCVSFSKICGEGTLPVFRAKTLLHIRSLKFT